MSQHPVLWSFRRCPYAMRARLAVSSANLRVELREILLRAKPDAFLDTSPTGTVPALRLPDRVIDESLDIMVWALKKNDPQRLLKMPADGWTLIKTNDGPFKTALDHTKYISRYPERDESIERAAAARHLMELESRLTKHGCLCDDRPTLADIAILPFVRQFANIDRIWFDAQPWPHVIAWLDRFTGSSELAHIMAKYPQWSEGASPIWFGDEA